MNETYIKIKGKWKYIFRAVYKKAALRFFKKAMRQHGLPDKVTIDKSGTHIAAIKSLKWGNQLRDRDTPIKYLNNMVE